MAFRPLRISSTTLALLAAAVVTSGRVALAGPMTSAAASPAPSFAAEDLAFFENEVRPLLAEQCNRCHNDQKQKGNLRLDSRSFVLKGGDHGPAVDPAAPEQSVLLRAVGYADEDLQMPPAGKLSDKQIASLTRWVKAGAPWPVEAEPVAATPATHAEESRNPDDNRDRWAYRRPVRPDVPKVQDTNWVRNPVDAFVLAKLEAKGLHPNPPADRIALVRRAYYDLTGLPPTPAEVDAFVADRSPDAWEKLIDRLLASPRYGETWGRHWLDLVRYAETHGYERDNPKPAAWRYRDYVINSFNKDKPYDRFLREQLAGDELDEVTTESLVATGYYRLGIWDDEPADRDLARYDVLDGVVSTTASVVLGMSIGCARCHDHKKDPILAKDYYSMLAFFQDVSDMNAKNTKLVADEAGQSEANERLSEKRQKEGELLQSIAAIEREYVARRKASGKALVGLAGEDLAELKYHFYRETFDNLPDFAGLKPEESGDVADNLVSVNFASRLEAIGLSFEGKLRVPQDGRYTFKLQSTEGVRLSVDGVRVIDRPSRGEQSGSFTADLKAGFADFRLDYFNGYGKPRLDLSWSGPGFGDRTLSRPQSDLGASRVIVADSRRQPQAWQYTDGANVPANWMQPDFSADGWQQGMGAFGSRGKPNGSATTEWRSSQIHLRQTFTLDRVPSSAALTLFYDEDAEVYLNGVLAFRGDGFLTAYKQVPISDAARAALKPGSNLLAVTARQTGGAQYIDVGLVEGPATVRVSEEIARNGSAVLEPSESRTYHRLTQLLEKSRQAPADAPGLEVMCVAEATRHRPTHILIRGNPGAEGDLVTPAFPTVLTPRNAPPPQLPAASLDGKSSGKRRVLADWLASPDNPLTARVMANRVWQYHFGRGLNPSPNEYGRLGEPVTHPELLDWLGSELVADGWRLKPLHKLIMMSNAYQMSAQASAKELAADPANDLYWRFNMRRLGAEEVRDSMLEVAGDLNLKMGGPSVYPPIPAEVLAGQSRPGSGWGKSNAEDAARRSVYVHSKRSLLVPVLSVHDQADTDTSCPVRFTTTVPTQSLLMLNGAFANEQAGHLAARLKRDAPTSVGEQVARAIRLTTGRQPDAPELQADLKFISELQTQNGVTADEALRLYCLMALNTNEFVYLE